MSVEQTVAPTVEPISTADALIQAKVEPLCDITTGTSTSSNDFNNTTNPLTVTGAKTTYTDLTFNFGSMFKIESEILEVQSISGNDVTFTRGAAGTSIAAHAASTAIAAGNPDQEEFLRQLVITARERVEEDTWHQLINGTYVAKRRAFPKSSAPMVLPYPPLGSVTSIQYIDGDGATQTWATTEYTVDTKRHPGLVTLQFNKLYKTTRDEHDAVTATFVAGFGATGANVPNSLLHAVKLLVSDWWKNRAPIGEDQRAYDRLINRYRYRAKDTRLLDWFD